MSDYECVCEPMEGEPWTQLSDQWRRARKEHKCCECEDIIRVGERYNYLTGVFEGKLEIWKTCEFCAHERTRLQAKAPFTIAFGDLACCVVAECRGEL